MIEEKRRPGYLKLGLVDQKGQVVTTTPLEFQDAILEKFRKRGRFHLIWTRGEVAKAVERAYRDLVEEIKAESIRR